MYDLLQEPKEATALREKLVDAVVGDGKIPDQTNLKDVSQMISAVNAATDNAKQNNKQIAVSRLKMNNQCKNTRHLNVKTT